jgi:hypothetical protein
MADLTVTSTNVISGDNAHIQEGQFGETVIAGQVVYKSSTTNLWMRADANSVTIEARHAIGIALNGGAVNQPAIVQTSGKINVGATLTPGAAYYVSANPGGICPVADVTTGSAVCQLGLAESTSLLDLAIQFPNVTL